MGRLYSFHEGNKLDASAELDIWQDAWFPHFHPEYGEPVPVHVHSPDFGWGLDFDVGFSLVGDLDAMDAASVLDVARFFEARLARLRWVRRQVRLRTLPPAVRQGLVLELSGVECLFEGLLTLLGAVAEGV